VGDIIFPVAIIAIGIACYSGCHREKNRKIFLQAFRMEK
jgi:hypothetical protein